MKRKGFSLQPGIRRYDEMLELQSRINTARQRGMIPDVVLFLEHCPCITVGRNGTHDNITASFGELERKGIRIYETDRGGDVTVHGPGQVVCYPIIDLGAVGMDIYDYARTLETMIIDTLKSFGIRSDRKRGFPGVWTGSFEKIAFEGIAVERGITMHGISLNVDNTLDHFSLIVPCGLDACEVTSMRKCLGYDIDTGDVIEVMRDRFSELFCIELADVGIREIKEMLCNESIAS